MGAYLPIAFIKLKKYWRPTVILYAAANVCIKQPVIHVIKESPKL